MLSNRRYEPFGSDMPIAHHVLKLGTAASGDSGTDARNSRSRLVRKSSGPKLFVTLQEKFGATDTNTGAFMIGATYVLCSGGSVERSWRVTSMKDQCEV